MSEDTHWKERLAFSSGIILTWGVILLSSWPAVSRFQVGQHVTFLTLNLPQEGVKPGLWIFWSLTMLLALGAGATILATMHIICRGMWLASFIEAQRVPAFAHWANFFDRTCLQLWDAPFVLLAYTGVLLIMTGVVLGSAGLEAYLGTLIQLSPVVVGWISRFVAILVAFGLSGLIIWKTKDSPFWRAPFQRVNRFVVVVPTLVFLVGWGIISHACYDLTP